MKNIVWLASYPKSGNTWFRMFLANYEQNAEKPLPLEKIEATSIASSPVDFEEQTGLNPFELYHDEVGTYRPDMYRALSEKIERKEENCYKKVHDAYTLNMNNEPIFPEDVSRCVVYFVRNPFDVCVSFANHGANKIEKTFKLLLNEEAFIAGGSDGQLRQKLLSWGNHVQSWKNQSVIPVHIARYEDMLLSPVETFGGIVRFLGLEYEEERLKRAIYNSDFKQLQQMENENGFKERLQRNKQFFWKGKIGNYHDFLSKEQIDKIVEYNYNTMKEFGYIDKDRRLTV